MEADVNKKNPAETATAKRSRRVLDDAFKTKEVLEALKEAMALNELAGKCEVHSNQISQWKVQFLKSATSVFCGPKDERGLEQLREERDLLRKRIGEKDMENEFLKKLEETEPALRLGVVDRKFETPVTRQCRWLGIKRGKVNHLRQVSAKKQEPINPVGELYAEDPTRGQRRTHYALRNEFGASGERSSVQIS